MRREFCGRWEASVVDSCWRYVCGTRRHKLCPSGRDWPTDETRSADIRQNMISFAQSCQNDRKSTIFTDNYNNSDEIQK